MPLPWHPRPSLAEQSWYLAAAGPNVPDPELCPQLRSFSRSGPVALSLEGTHSWGGRDAPAPPFTPGPGSLSFLGLCLGVAARAAREPGPSSRPSSPEARGFQSLCPWAGKQQPNTSTAAGASHPTGAHGGQGLGRLGSGSALSTATRPLLLVSPQPLSQGCVWAGTPPPKSLPSPAGLRTRT